jgi:tripartite-type tricarboxylate transporter receptor subunit TctC
VPPLTSALGLIRDGKLVPLAVSSSTRSRALPNVPTMVEAGLKPDAVYPFYTGVYVPAKTPRAVVEKLNAEVTKALALPAVQKRLVAVSVDPMTMTLAEFGAFFRKDVAANLELVKTANMPRQ